MDKIKITFFIPNLEVGGAEKVTVNLLKWLNRDNFSPQLLLQEKKGYHLGAVPRDVFVADFSGSNLFFCFLKLMAYLKEDRPDVFVSVFPRFSVVSILAKIFSKSPVKLIIVEHSIFSSTAVNARTFFRRFVAKFMFPFLMRHLYKFSEAIICVSKGVAEDISKIIGLTNKIKIIYNPIISDEIYRLSKDPIDEAYAEREGMPVVLAVGRLAIAKDYPTLLKAFQIVSKSIPTKLVILGSGEEQRKLVEFVRKLKISDRVYFLGLQENPYKFMANASVFVLSSKQEGFSTVIVEAMACGLPVVSTDCKSGPSEIITDMQSGFLVKVGDSRMMANAIIEVLEDRDLRDRFSKRGRERAKDFTAQIKTKEYENIFLNL